MSKETEKKESSNHSKGRLNKLPPKSFLVLRLHDSKMTLGYSLEIHIWVETSPTEMTGLDH
jgi:hypothetical protein